MGGQHRLRGRATARSSASSTTRCATSSSRPSATARRRSTAARSRRRRKSDLATALVGTGFGYDAEVRRAQAVVAARLLPEVRDLRRFGAAAIDLAWTACGRLDAYYEHGLNAWDLAAGGLICERAGLEVRPLRAGRPVESGRAGRARQRWLTRSSPAGVTCAAPGRPKPCSSPESSPSASSS